MKTSHPQENSRRPGRRAVNAILALSQQYHHKGQHHAALSTLDRIATLPSSDAGVWAWKLAHAARNRLHLSDDAGTLQCLAGVDDGVRRANPCLDSECFSIGGILKMRTAHRLWKIGNTKLAQNKIQEAIEDFVSARDVAEYRDQRTRLNAELNIVYCCGMDSAIRNESDSENPGLASRAIEIEHQLRQWSAPAERDDVTGLTIIGDLALGAHLKVQDLFPIDYSDNQSAARRAVLKSPESNWSELLLDAVRAHNVRPEIAARGLILGARTLLRYESDDVRSRLLKPYAVRMQAALLDVQSETQAETQVTHNLRTWIKACVEAGNFHFAGRRTFR